MPKQPKTDYNDVCELVRQAEQDYVIGTTKSSRYVEHSMYEDLNKIDAYLNSKHTNGDVDSQNREKPFFNIVTAAVNIWYRATDIDRKDIKIRSTKRKDDIAAFLATVHLQHWMRKINFGKFLNKWGRSLAKYGSSVVKFVEKEGDLVPLVIPWSRLIVDAVDFDSNPVIEKLQLTPAQLRNNKSYDQDIVEKLIDAVEARSNLDGQKKDTKTNFIELYEIHGDLSKAYKTGKESDEDTYKQQMHVISFVASNEEGGFDDFTLFSGFEGKSPYMLTHLIEEDDQTLGIGAVQNLFDAQWMVNHSVKSIKDQLDLASQIIYQTSDGNFVGQNALSAIQNGDILIHAVNQPLTTVGTNNALVVAPQQSMMAMWQSLGSQINGISEAMLGKNAPAGSAWRQTEALLQESHSLFEVMTQSKKLHVEDMLTEFVIDHIKKKMDTTEEIAATLDSYHIDKIDSMFIPNKAIRRHNERATELVLNGQDAPEFNQGQEEAQVQTEMKQQGNNRYFKPSDFTSKTWKNVFKDLEWDCEVGVPGEQRDAKVAADTILGYLKMITSATPEQLNDPNFKLGLNKLLELSGEISPIEIASIPPTPPPPPVNKVSESISFKDLPFEGQQQMAGQAGIKITQPKPEPVLEQQPL